MVSSTFRRGQPIVSIIIETIPIIIIIIIIIVVVVVVVVRIIIITIIHVIIIIIIIKEDGCKKIDGQFLYRRLFFF